MTGIKYTELDMPKKVAAGLAIASVSPLLLYSKSLELTLIVGITIGVVFSAYRYHKKHPVKAEEKRRYGRMAVAVLAGVAFFIAAHAML